jgi:SRSO17 transposase
MPPPATVCTRASEPIDYWLSTLPADTPLRELVGLAKIRWRIEHDYRELKDGLGLWRIPTLPVEGAPLW